MSWLRNGQVSLVALAVSAAIGLAGCGGAESDREGGNAAPTVFDNAVRAFERNITETAGGALSLSKFATAAGDDKVLSYQEANTAIAKDYRTAKQNEYYAANMPAAKTFDKDGDGKLLSPAEQAAYTATHDQITSDAAAYAQAIALSNIPQFANQDELLAAFDADKNALIEAIDFDLVAPPDVTPIELDALKGKAASFYIRGTITDQWSDGNIVESFKPIETSSGVFEFDYDSPAEGFGSFKTGAKGWSDNSVNCGTSAQVVVWGKETEDAAKEGFVGDCGPASSDIKVYFYTGTYRIKIDRSNPAAPKFWVIRSAAKKSAVQLLKEKLSTSSQFYAAAAGGATDNEKKQLTFEEAKAVSPELSQSEFIDLAVGNYLGYLTPADLGIVTIPPVKADCGDKVPATDDGNLYLRGDLTGWNAGAKCKLTKTGTTYSLGIDLPGNPTEPVQFKIAGPQDNWGPTNCGATGASSGPSVDLTLSVDTTGACGQDDRPKFKLLIAEAGYYKFDLNLADPANPVFKVAKTTKPVAGGDKLPDGVQLYVRGEVTSWDAVDAGKLTWSDALGGYTVTVNGLTAKNYGFKVAASAWDAFNCGATVKGAPVAVGGSLVGQCSIKTGDTTVGTTGEDMALTISEAGNYAFNVIFKAVDGVYTPTFQVVKK